MYILLFIFVVVIFFSHHSIYPILIHSVCAECVRLCVIMSVCFHSSGKRTQQFLLRISAKNFTPLACFYYFGIFKGISIRLFSKYFCFAIKSIKSIFFQSSSLFFSFLCELLRKICALLAKYSAFKMRFEKRRWKCALFKKYTCCLRCSIDGQPLN